MTQYWVTRDGQRRGPYDESDILEGMELGTVRPTDLLWVEGMHQGVPITDVIGHLGGGSPASVPPPPPTSAAPLELAPIAPAAPSPYRPPSARVDDLAELTLGNIHYAGFWVRLAALMLDSLVFALVGIVIGVGIGFGGRFLGFQVGPGDLWPNVLGIVLSWLYFATLESGPHCASYGKRAFHLQVLGADHMTRIGFLRASARWLARSLSFLLFLIGYLMQPFTPRKRALHDFIAGTVVVAPATYSQLLLGLVLALGIGLPVIGFFIGAGLQLFGPGR